MEGYTSWFVCVSVCVCVLPLDLTNCKILENFEDMSRKYAMTAQEYVGFVVELQYRRETNG